MAREKSYRIKEDDNKNTIVLIAVLLVLIFLVGGGLLHILTQKGGGPPDVPPNQTGQTPVQNQTEPGTNESQTQECDDSCLLNAAVGAKNASMCLAISANATVQACYWQLSNVSLEACMALLNQSLRESCIPAYAAASGNLSLCDLLESGRSACRKGVDPCADATDLKLCRALDEEDPSLCGGEVSCLVNYSMIGADESGCSLIAERAVSTACKSAAKYTDSCSSLSADAERDYCYQLFAIYSNDVYTCTQISYNSKYAYMCLTHFAISRNDLTICNNERLDLNDKWACYRNYSLATGDLQGCLAIDPLASTNQFLCSFEYAKKFGDPSACEIISILASKKTCYEGAIVYSNSNLDWHNCGGVTNFVWRNKCYTESAKLYGDASICNNIDEAFAKETCQGAFALNQTQS